MYSLPEVQRSTHEEDAGPEAHRGGMQMKASTRRRDRVAVIDAAFRSVAWMPALPRTSGAARDEEPRQPPRPASRSPLADHARLLQAEFRQQQEDEAFWAW